MPDLTLSQFDQYAVGSAGPFSIDAFTGISGKSLQHVFGTGLQKSRLAVPQTATGVPKGIAVGQWSLALKRSVSNPVGFFGVTIAQSADNIISTGAAYTVTIARTGALSNRIRLAKHASGGLVGGVGTELAQAALTESTNVVTIRVIWDLTTGNFQVFQGAALNYSDLVSIFTYVDGSPLTATAEGFFVSDFNQGASTHTVWFDNIVLDKFS